VPTGERVWELYARGEGGGAHAWQDRPLTVAAGLGRALALPRRPSASDRMRVGVRRL
jgi:hypothetical protein